MNKKKLNKGKKRKIYSICYGSNCPAFKFYVKKSEQLNAWSFYKCDFIKKTSHQKRIECHDALNGKLKKTKKKHENILNITNLKGTNFYKMKVFHLMLNMLCSKEDSFWSVHQKHWLSQKNKTPCNQTTERYEACTFLKKLV